MEMRKSYSLCLFLVILLPCLGFASDQVPFIAWSSTNSLQSIPRIDAGHIVNQQSLQQDYLDVLPMDQPHNLFLIVMDKLSIDDITRYSNAHSSNPDGGTLTHLKNAMQSSASQLVLPAAETIDLEDDLRSRVSGQVVELASPSLKDLKLDSTKSNLIIIRLDSSPSESRQAAMSSLDQALLQILGQIPGKFSPYTVVLTAQQPSRAVKEKAKPESVNIGRHLLQTAAPGADSNYTYVNYTEGACKVYFYATGMKLDVVNVSRLGTTNVSLPYDGWVTDGSECKNTTIKFVMSHNDIGGNEIKTFKLTMVFNQTLGQYKYWVTESVEITLNDEFNFPMDTTDFVPNSLSTPVGLSYHCSDLTIQENSTRGSLEDKVRLDVKEFQVQPFGINGEKFSQANDCVGYFSAGIWMGLIVTIILVLILGSGMAMLADLKVMDKFDDPKGKTITVNVSD
ncbi:V-type proton ATPase subunit S1-like [Amphiura filiformis]|uniref:V-type proton ATPase subunit S1-like n=1 Tax=Amphiura filiformis TaxID=82378 RepID=UPI003B21E5D5